MKKELEEWIERIKKDTSFVPILICPNVLDFIQDDYYAFLIYVKDRHCLNSDDIQHVIDQYVQTTDTDPDYLYELADLNSENYQEYFQLLLKYYDVFSLQLLLPNSLPVLIISNNKYDIELSLNFNENLYEIQHRYSHYPFHNSTEKVFYYFSDAIQEMYILAVCFDRFNTRHVNVDDRRKVLIELLSYRIINL